MLDLSQTVEDFGRQVFSTPKTTPLGDIKLDVQLRLYRSKEMGSQHFTALPALLDSSKTSDLKKIVKKAHDYKSISNEPSQLPFVGCFYFKREVNWFTDETKHNSEMLVVYLFEGYEELVTFNYPHKTFNAFEKRDNEILQRVPKMQDRAKIYKVALDILRMNFEQ